MVTDINNIELILTIDLIFIIIDYLDGLDRLKFCQIYKNDKIISKIKIIGDNFWDSDLEFIFNLKELKYLDISGSELITNCGIEKLKSLTNLTHLSLKSLTDIDNTCIHLVLKYLTKLNYLNLNSCSQITDSGLKALTKLSDLTHLDLGNCSQITDLGLESIDKFEYLNYLDISGYIHLYKDDYTSGIRPQFYCVTDDSLKHIGRLSNLTHLVLSQITDFSPEGFYEIGRLSHLKYLDISYCDITEDYMDMLTNLTELTYLNLSCGLITELDFIIRLTNLIHLDLSNCRKLFICKFHQIATLTKLKVLSLSNVVL